MAPEAVLALADGRVFRGRAFGALGEVTGGVIAEAGILVAGACAVPLGRRPSRSPEWVSPGA